MDMGLWSLDHFRIERECTVRSKRQSCTGGFTMVELLVVLSIFAVIASLAIPAFVRMGMFARNDLNMAAREMVTLLKTAQSYASTYNVTTAVVFDRFAWQDDTTVPNTSFGVTRSAVVMYQPKSLADAGLEPGNPGPREGEFIPLPGDAGEMRLLPGTTALYLADLDSTTAPNVSRSMSEVGLQEVNAWFYEGFETTNDYLAQYELIEPEQEELKPFPAFVFKPSGRMVVTGETERYRVFIAPQPTEAPSMRLQDPEIYEWVLNDNGELRSNFRNVCIELYRSTGRINVAS